MTRFKEATEKAIDVIINGKGSPTKKDIEKYYFPYLIKKGDQELYDRFIKCFIVVSVLEESSSS